MNAGLRHRRHIQSGDGGGKRSVCERRVQTHAANSNSFQGSRRRRPNFKLVATHKSNITQEFDRLTDGNLRPMLRASMRAVYRAHRTILTRSKIARARQNRAEAEPDDEAEAETEAEAKATDRLVAQTRNSQQIKVLIGIICGALANFNCTNPTPQRTVAQFAPQFYGRRDALRSLSGVFSSTRAAPSVTPTR